MLRSIVNTISTAACLLAAALSVAPAYAATSAGTSAAPDAHPAFQVRVSGNPQGKPIVLIPGLASSGAVWDGTVAHYCGSAQSAYQCHVLTLAGFAGVAPIDGPLLPAAEAQLSEYIAAHKLAQPTIVGHSLGGFLTLKLAADHPEQVGRAVVVDAVPALAALQLPSMTAAQAKEVAEAARRNMLAQDAAAARAATEQSVRMMVTREQDVQRVLAWGVASDRVTVINAMADLMGDDLRETVARVKAPTLVLGGWAAYQAYVPKAAFEQTYRTQYARLPGVQLEVAEKARHFIMLDDPAWMYDRIDHFLN